MKSTEFAQVRKTNKQSFKMEAKTTEVQQIVVGYKKKSLYFRTPSQDNLEYRLLYCEAIMQQREKTQGHRFCTALGHISVICNILLAFREYSAPQDR